MQFLGKTEPEFSRKAVPLIFTERAVVAAGPRHGLVPKSRHDESPNCYCSRLTNAFSKKLENLKAVCSLHFLHYNFCRVHQSLRITPAMAAGITDTIWPLETL